ncbi:MAG: ATP-grasp domain-containing protein [Candidatus Omnitrophica bacterium]|nr:ATP-grasp domain-containing protein [Candidatus Omnitrophota bacterium]
MTYDLKTEYPFKVGDPEDANAEFDHPSTVQVIRDAIASLGHRVVPIGSAEQLLKGLDLLEVDLVFNIAEGYLGRNREAQVPILLELKGIPCVGSDGLTLSLTLDKLMTKKVLLSEGIPTPRFFEMKHPDDSLPPDLSFPLIVKPRYEGSSKGISEQSVVHSAAQLRARTGWVIQTYRQPALIEEFIRGTEFTVALVGNDPAEALPVVQIQIDGRTDLGDLFYTFSRIASGAGYLCPARISGSLESRLKELALRTYHAVDCLDFGRVDIRVDQAGKPYVLEINPLPSLSTEDVFMVVANHLGISYPQMLGKILSAACERLRLTEKPARQAATGSRAQR